MQSARVAADVASLHPSGWCRDCVQRWAPSVYPCGLKPGALVPTAHMFVGSSRSPALMFGVLFCIYDSYARHVAPHQVISVAGWLLVRHMAGCCCGTLGAQSFDRCRCAACMLLPGIRCCFEPGCGAVLVYVPQSGLQSNLWHASVHPAVLYKNWRWAAAMCAGSVLRVVTGHASTNHDAWRCCVCGTAGLQLWCCCCRCPYHSRSNCHPTAMYACWPWGDSRTTTWGEGAGGLFVSGVVLSC